MRPLSTLLLVFSLLLTGCEGRAEGKHIQELDNLYTLGQQARQTNLPIMLSFGAEWCDFCHLLNEEVLNPMALGGRYEGKYMYMRYVSIDDDQPIPGIDNQPIIKDKWSDNFDVQVTPTVVFIDGNGKQIAPTIVGVTNVDLYSAMIHESLNIAYQNLNNPLRIPLMADQMKE